MPKNYLYQISVNVEYAVKHSLGFEHCALIKFFMLLPNWAEKIEHEGEIFYRANMKKIHEQLPMLSSKDDTIYRYIKKLVDLGVVAKVPKLDYYKITQLCLEYGFVGNKSEQSEINPIDVGNKSDTQSEKFPIYKNTKYDNNTNDKILSNDNTPDGVPPRKIKSIINKDNKGPAIKIYDYIKKLTGVIDGDLNDCVYLHYKLEGVTHFTGSSIEKLEQIIPLMIEKGISTYYSISSPQKLTYNLGTIVSKIATGNFIEAQAENSHIYIK